MAVLEMVESGHGHVADLRDELERVREVLDRTDAVLGVTDDALERAEAAIVTTRKVTRSATPYVVAGLALAAVGVVAVVVWRRRRRPPE